MSAPVCLGGHSLGFFPQSEVYMHLDVPRPVDARGQHHRKNLLFGRVTISDRLNRDDCRGVETKLVVGAEKSRRPSWENGLVSGCGDQSFAAYLPWK